MDRDELQQLCADADVVLAVDRLKFDGIFTTFADMYLNLKLLHVNALLVTIVHDSTQALALVNKLRTSTPVAVNEWHVVQVDQARGVHCRQLVVSFGALLHSDDYTLTADDKLVVLCSGTVEHDVVVHHGRGVAYTSALAVHVNLHIFGNACQQRHFPHVNFTVHQQHFARARLEFIERHYPITPHTVYDETYRTSGVMSGDALRCERLVYGRWDRNWGTAKPGYFENIGKLIFEFRWLGRPVRYLPVNRFAPDGLTEYLALFGVDDLVDQELTFTRVDVDRLLVGLTMDDQLVQVITR